MRGTWRFAVGIIAAVAVWDRGVAAQNVDRRQLERIEQTLRQEGEAVVALADASRNDRSAPADFRVSWHNDFLKAQFGTFIPFVVTVEGGERPATSALLYVRAARRRAEEGEDARSGRRRGSEAAFYPFEEIYPIELAAKGAAPVRFARGFSLPSGEYDLTVVVRERDGEAERKRRRMAAVLRRRLTVPDYTTGELTTSTVILADRFTVLPQPVPASDLPERPYVIGTREIQPAADSVLRRAEELIVLFLVYNPTVTADKHFDLEVEYHFFRKSRDGADSGAQAPGGANLPAALPGERYFNRTDPQRFTPLVLGAEFSPGNGQPVLAGQGVPMTDFQDGDYRLAIRVTDLISGRSILRQVAFSVRP